MSQRDEVHCPVTDLQGKHVVVTAGGTREPLDPIRFIGNRSSGKMGFALADAARERGARVTLITTVPPPASRRLRPRAVRGNRGGYATGRAYGLPIRRCPPDGR